MENTDPISTFADLCRTPDHRLIDVETMTDEEIREQVMLAFDDIENGRVCTVEESRENIERIYRKCKDIM